MFRRFCLSKNPTIGVCFGNISAFSPPHCRCYCTPLFPKQLEKAFGATNWLTFTTNMPEWEKNLANKSEDYIGNGLQKPPFSFSFVEASAMATALAEHFKEKAVEPLEIPGFYQAIESAQLVKSGDVERLTLANFNWLTHPKDDGMDTVYVRDAYKRLWDVVKTAHAIPVDARNVQRSDVLVIGNPGIGKSWCLNYLLYLALTEKLTSLVILRSRQGWYCFHSGKCYKFQQFPGEVWVNNKLKRGERGLLLHDIGKANAKVDVNFEITSYGNVCIVLSSSPNVANYVAFQNSYQPVHFYCPMLSRGEFASIHPQQLHEFDKFGGCLRHVGNASRGRTLQEKIDVFDFSKASLSLISQEDTHCIIQVVPEVGNSEEYHLDFVSEEIKRMFFDSRWDALKNQVIKNLYRKLNNNNERQLYGIPFEDYVQNYAHKLDFTNLTNIDGSALAPNIIPSNFAPPSSFKLIASSKSDLHKKIKESNSEKSRWIQPNIPNFPVLDAFLLLNNKVYGVQSTLSDTHQPQTSQLKALLEQGVSFGDYKPKKKVHIDGVILVVDKYRKPLMSKPQLVPVSRDKKGAPVPNTIGDAWKSNNPQYRLLVSCKEWEK